MKPLVILAAALAMLSLVGCEEEKYPVSGEECGPNDPVKELEASDCLPPTGSV